MQLRSLDGIKFMTSCLFPAYNPFTASLSPPQTYCPDLQSSPYKSLPFSELLSFQEAESCHFPSAIYASLGHLLIYFSHKHHSALSPAVPYSQWKILKPPVYPPSRPSSKLHTLMHKEYCPLKTAKQEMSYYCY